MRIEHGFLPGIIAPGPLNWTPKKATSLRAWFDPHTIVQASGNVTSWTDRSSSGITLAQGTGSKQPLYDTGNPRNGWTGAKFDGVDDVLFGSAPSITGTSFTMATVLCFTAAEAGQGYAANVADDGFTCGYCFNTAASRAVTHVGQAPGLDGAATLNTEIWVETFDGATDHFYVNGAEQTLTPAPGAVVAPNASARISLGAFGSTNVSPAKIRIFEFALFNAVLSAADLASLHGYLKRKYAL